MKNLVLVPLHGLCNRLRTIASAAGGCEAFDVPLRVVWQWSPWEKNFAPIPGVTAFSEIPAPRHNTCNYATKYYGEGGMVSNQNLRTEAEELAGTRPRSDEEEIGISSQERQAAHLDEIRRNARSSYPNERFMILARTAGSAPESLTKVLEPLGRVEVILDSQGVVEGSGPTGAQRRTYLPDGAISGFVGLMGRSGSFPEITAWSRALAHLANTLQPDEGVWFVEDDVAGDTMSFAELVAKTVALRVDLAAMDIRSKREDAGWYFWNNAEGFFDEPSKAFQPLCRVSGRLLREILNFQEKHGFFIFHEILFASLNRQLGGRYLSWNDDRNFEHLFPEFRYRPEVEVLRRGICHPVKDEHLHRQICLIDDFSERSSWYHKELERWKQLFSTDLPVKVLQIGIGDSLRLHHMLEEIFINPLSEIHGIEDLECESGEISRRRFGIPAEQSHHAARLHLYEGMSCEVLAWMIAGDGFWESFDFIHLNNKGDAGTMLTDACQAWHLLKSGGLLVFGENANPKGMEAFLSVFHLRLERCYIGRRIGVRKCE